ncbi:MAG TPA: hypothetical protein VGI48_04125 [Caldimonas sp.]|jgi:hypothetical protein
MSVRIDPHAGASSRRLFATLAIAATFGAGFALGHHPQAGDAARFAASVAPELTGSVAVPIHDGSLPDTADTLSHERLRDDDPTPTF